MTEIEPLVYSIINFFSCCSSAQRKTHYGEKETAPGWAKVPVGSHLEASPKEGGSKKKQQRDRELQNTGRSMFLCFPLLLSMLLHKYLFKR